MKQKILQAMFAVLLIANANAQVNSGSNGSDGAFNPATNTVINMADHSNGIYQYTSVTISNGVTVTFIPNANNSPVTWLVQGNCEIDGTVDVSGQIGVNVGGKGGPGGGAGGSGGSNPNSGQGAGGGDADQSSGGGGSFGSQGGNGSNGANAGKTYGNSFLLPLLGGSGGGGSSGCNGGCGGGGCGGGGAILIAASGFIQLNGYINALGGGAPPYSGNSAGSGGGVRLIAVNVLGMGQINASGGSAGYYAGGSGGLGRIRIDSFQNNFGGQINGVFTQGYQPIIIPVAGQGVQLSIASVAGAAVSATPNGQLVSPDAIISGQQANPIPIVVTCANLPLNTLITVTVKPASGASVSAVGYNTAGTLASSTATVSLTMPRGGGIIYATAATGN
jgi:hypothetical protein